MPKNDPLRGPTHPDKSANSGSTDPNFEIPSKAHESRQNLLRFMSKPEKIRILTLDPPPPIALSLNLLYRAMSNIQINFLRDGDITRGQ